MRAIKRVRLLIEISRGYGRDLIKGIVEYSRMYGPWSFITDQATYKRRNHGHAKTYDWKIDGIIAHTDNLTEVKAAVKKGIPVIVEKIRDIITDFPTMQTNDYAVGIMGAEYFIGKGFKRFGYCGFENIYWSENRGESFCERIKQAGYDPHVFKPDRSKTAETTELAVLSRWLKSLPKPIGLMACNDDRSQDVLEACMLEDILVPEEVAILGVDNDTMVCELSELPLSSIVLSTERVGFLAAQMLDKIMRGEKVEKRILLSEPLYVETRKSTDILAIEDIDAARALQFIQDNIRRKIAVEDIAEQMCLSRRMAEIRFKKAVGRSINHEIQNRRVRLICKLLVESNMSVSQIAENAGFSKTSYMIEIFKKQMKMTPLAYRKKYKPSDKQVV